MQKTILITGVSNGFGKDTAVSMAAAGHHVFGPARVVVGNPFGAADVNAVVSPIQHNSWPASA